MMTLRRLFRYFVCYLLVLVIMCLVYYVVIEPEWNWDTVTILAGCSGFLSMLLIGLNPHINFIGFVGIYGLYLTLAHLGTVLSDLIDPHALDSIQEHMLWWVRSDYRPYTVALSGIGIACFSLGANFTSFLQKNKKRDLKTIDEKGHPGIFAMGITLLAIVSFYLVFSFGTGRLPLFGSYMDYWEALEKLPEYVWILFFFAVGIDFMLATADRKQLKIGGIMFAISAGLLMLTGNRGEVMYPSAAGMAILLNRGFKINMKLVLIGLIAFFVIIPIISETRTTAKDDLDVSEISLSFTDPFVEIGYTLRPFVVTVGWIKEGENHGQGKTYTLPVKRLLGLAIPFYERPSIIDNKYILRDRTPTQGYSVLAEAYYNFGLAGVMIVPALIGAFLVTLGDHAPNNSTLAFVGGITAVLINNIRNGFSFVPGQILMVGILFTVGLMIQIIRQSSNKSGAKELQT
ncbi:O-antigen polysaccharide polymerase Wzy [Brevibacillus dissolubilis]|uniref:O-antigen polysaccharide polymerase Wzy n=1 Tax=Brevibacillus dissolubilis TaxID=1844116 RepID=UPI001116C467|nr:O-antigen polysaccharide polymerase Wzy [Brevibacillus dissolubilis]